MIDFRFSYVDSKQGFPSIILAFMFGSAKANLADGGAASGVTSLAKALAAVEEDLISPHCYIIAAVNYESLKTPRERNVIAVN